MLIFIIVNFFIFSSVFTFHLYVSFLNFVWSEKKNEYEIEMSMKL